MSGEQTGAVVPWRDFRVRVDRVRRLSRSFVRVTLTGEDLDTFADNGYDQRIKLVFPLPEVGLDPLPTGPDWYPRWRELPEARRNPIRTYTVRAVRPHAREVDVDLVRHGETGPASRWAGAAAPGDALVVIGPDARYPADHGGREFRPPGGAGRAPVLLAGDETAVPAICAILERLPASARGEALLEVPHPADALPVSAPAGVRVGWLPRTTMPHGARLLPAAAAAAARLLPAHGPADRAGGRRDGCYAWLAGEAAVVRSLRRHLVGPLGLDRQAVTFMGYWRHGRAEPTG